jgi:multidrug transporter EmrE-like cation transporter
MVYVIALFLAITVEVIIGVFLKFRKKQEILAIALVNLITNPLLNCFLFVSNYFRLFRVDMTIILILEAIVVLVEWLLLRFALRQRYDKLLILSVVMNVSSYISGIFIFGNPVI